MESQDKKGNGEVDVRLFEVSKISAFALKRQSKPGKKRNQNQGLRQSGSGLQDNGENSMGNQGRGNSQRESSNPSSMLQPVWKWRWGGMNRGRKGPQKIKPLEELMKMTYAAKGAPASNPETPPINNSKVKKKKNRERPIPNKEKGQKRGSTPPARLTGITLQKKVEKKRKKGKKKFTTSIKPTG